MHSSGGCDSSCGLGVAITGAGHGRALRAVIIATLGGSNTSSMGGSGSTSTQSCSRTLAMLPCSCTNASDQRHISLSRLPCVLLHPMMGFHPQWEMGLIGHPPPSERADICLAMLAWVSPPLWGLQPEPHCLGDFIPPLILAVGSQGADNDAGV